MTERKQSDDGINMYEERQYYIYIMTNPTNTVLYTGMTNDLARRVCEHKEKQIKGFTSRYNIIKLVYYEIYGTAYDAISREKQIKAGSRKKKLDLINKLNPAWLELYNNGEILPLEWE